MYVSTHIYILMNYWKLLTYLIIFKGVSYLSRYVVRLVIGSSVILSENIDSHLVNLPYFFGIRVDPWYCPVG